MPGRSGGLQFAAQVPDVGVDGPLVSFEGEAVCRLEQLQAVEDLPGMAQEELEQGERAPQRRMAGASYCFWKAGNA